MAPATVQNRRYTGTYTQPLPYWPLRPACDWLPAPPSDVSPAKGTVGLNLEPGGGAVGLNRGGGCNSAIVIRSHFLCFPNIFISWV